MEKGKQAIVVLDRGEVERVFENESLANKYCDKYGLDNAEFVTTGFEEDAFNELFGEDIVITLQKQNETPILYEGAIKKTKQGIRILFKKDQSTYSLLLTKKTKTLSPQQLGLLKRYANLSKRKILILKELKNGKKTSQELSKSAEVYSSILSPYLWDLIQRGLIVRIKRGEFEITENGKDVLVNIGGKEQ